MFIICKNYLCCYMTHSCMLGMLSSGAVERLLNYKVCKSYHCPVCVTLQCKLIRSKSATWRDCHCASHHYQLFLFYLKTLTTLSSKSSSTSAGELLRNAQSQHGFPRRTQHGFWALVHGRGVDQGRRVVGAEAETGKEQGNEDHG